MRQICYSRYIIKEFGGGRKSVNILWLRKVKFSNIVNFLNELAYQDKIYCSSRAESFLSIFNNTRFYVYRSCKKVNSFVEL